MLFVSTRGKAPPVSLSQAIRNGAAPDGGLYKPETVPASFAVTSRFAPTGRSTTGKSVSD